MRARSQVHLLVIYIVTATTSRPDLTDRSELHGFRSLDLFQPGEISRSLRYSSPRLMLRFSLPLRTSSRERRAIARVDIRPAGTREKFQSNRTSRDFLVRSTILQFQLDRSALVFQKVHFLSLSQKRSNKTRINFACRARTVDTCPLSRTTSSSGSVAAFSSIDQNQRRAALPMKDRLAPLPRYRTNLRATNEYSFFLAIAISRLSVCRENRE